MPSKLQRSLTQYLHSCCGHSEGRGLVFTDNTPATAEWHGGSASRQIQNEENTLDIILLEPTYSLQATQSVVEAKCLE